MSGLFDPGYYEGAELAGAGFRSLGEDVMVSKNCTIIGCGNISLGNHVRIDGYCTLIAVGGGEIKLGSYIHIGSYSLLSGGDGIEMEDFAGLSQGVKIYSRTDDYTGRSLTNPTVPEKYTEIVCGPVRLGRHVIIGSGTVILPNVTIAEGSSVGALSLVNRSLDPWGLHAGIPVRRLKDRSRRLLEMEKALLEDPKFQPEKS